MDTAQGPAGGPGGAQGAQGGPRGPRGGQGGPGGPPKRPKSAFLSTRPAWPGLRPPGPWTRCGEGSGSSWPGGLGVPSAEMPAPSRVKTFWGLGYTLYWGDQYWSPGEPAPVPGPSWVLPSSWLQEAGKRPGSTFAIEVEGLKRRPPSVGGRPRP